MAWATTLKPWCAVVIDPWLDQRLEHKISSRRFKALRADHGSGAHHNVDARHNEPQSQTMKYVFINDDFVLSLTFIQIVLYVKSTKLMTGS